MSVVPADAADKRVALFAALASLLIFLGVAPFAGLPLTPAPVTVAVFQVTLIVNDLVTAVLLLGQLRVARSQSMLILSCGYLFTAIMSAAYLLAFPGVFREAGLLGDRLQSPAYLFVFWHSAFALFVMAYALFPDRLMIPENSRGAIFFAALATVLIALGLVTLATKGSSLLPHFFDGDRYGSVVGRYGQWALTSAALVVMFRRRPHSVLDLWILLTLLVVWFEIALVAIFNTGRFDLGFYAGRIYGVVGSVFVLGGLLVEQGGLYAGLIDAHDRARAEIAERETEARFHLLADTMPQLAWITGTDGAEPWFNRRFYEYTGLVPGELKGMALERHIHDPAALPLVWQRWERSLETGEPFEMVMRLRGADGRFRHFLTRALPLRNAQGKVVQWFGTNTDVTVQHEAEQALREADRRKDEFLATLAHELRNPLAPMRNAATIMRLLGPLPEDLEKARDVIDRQTRHLARLIDDLMDVSRVTQGKIHLERERADLRALLEEAIDAVRPSIDASGHDLSVRLPDAPLEAQADPTRIQQIFVNLLNNAVKFTPRGGQIWLAAERAGDEAIIRVRDTGIGIAEEHLESVFAMFSQPAPPLQRREAGLGIGLALVRGLVEMHGGTVRAHSRGRGKGSEFVVHLPVLAVQDDRRAPVAVSAPPHAATHGKRVLVVDDNGDVATTLRRLLEMAGHDVREAHDGFEGVHVATEFKPQIVLLDIGMPGMNGYDVAKEIRQRAASDPPRLVALTGWGQAADKARAREAGFDLHLTKPVDPEVLLELIDA